MAALLFTGDDEAKKTCTNAETTLQVEVRFKQEPIFEKLKVHKRLWNEIGKENRDGVYSDLITMRKQVEDCVKK